MTTLAPAALKAETKASAFSLNGEIKSVVLLLPGKRLTQCAPLNSLSGILTTTGVVSEAGVNLCCAAVAIIRSLYFCDKFNIIADQLGKAVGIGRADDFLTVFQADFVGNIRNRFIRLIPANLEM